MKETGKCHELDSPLPVLTQVGPFLEAYNMFEFIMSQHWIFVLNVSSNTLDHSGCWWHGDKMFQGFNTHDIDFVILKSTAFSWNSANCYWLSIMNKHDLAYESVLCDLHTSA